MSDNFNDGGAAFPRTGTNTISGYGHPEQDGMSLRDYFAAKAMQAIYERFVGSPVVSDESCLMHAAGGAYLMADAMLKARES